MTDKSDNTTHFGFETVREDEKAGRVQGVFSSVASKYDIMNDVMSDRGREDSVDSKRVQR